jgi:hypothetical protein
MAVEVLPRMVLNDKSLLDEILKLEIQDCDFRDFVLGKDIIEILVDIRSSLLEEDGDLYSQEEKIKELWIKLIDKSIKCLRYFDEREPFKNNTNKKPETYRLEDLKSYFDHFSLFEGLLYGSNNEYRDHVIHVFRIWLLGVVILLTKKSRTDTQIIDKIELDGVDNRENKDKDKNNLFKPGRPELLSMWTLISLCHDLGYPLEKRDGIIKKTEEMINNFFPNASITMTYNNISGVYDESIRNIVKFISSKIEEESLVVENQKNENSTKDNQAKEEKSSPSKKYFSRIQSKYYNKINKSLESFSHGIISAIILFKSLEYFSESDFSIEGDYSHLEDDAKQFYIRREILRSIAIHTCFNVYHIKTNTFPFLLILCDELQEWDRRTFKDFYLKKQNIEYNVELDIDRLKENEVFICETLTINKITDYKILFNRYIRQYEKYRKIFRDGLDTSHREFSFNKKIKTNNEEIIFEIDISKKQDSKFIIQYKTGAAGEVFNSFIQEKIKNTYEYDVIEGKCIVYRRKY